MIPLIVAGMSLLGGLAQKKQDKKIAEGMQTRLYNTSLSGPAGMNAWAGEGGIGYDLGQFGPSFFNLTNLANDASAGARHSLEGLPWQVTQGDEALRGQPLDLGAFLRGGQGAEMLAGRSLGDVFNPSRTAEGVYNSELSLLRQAAAPEEQRMQQKFIGDLYATGRGAVTGAPGNEASAGGGRLAAAFGQGLARADIERQMQARQTGFRAAELEENLLTSAFGRFANMAGMAGDFNNAAFNRQRGVLQQNYERGIEMAGLPAQIAQLFQGVAGNATQNALAMGDFGLNSASLALNNTAAGANARIGAGSNIASFMQGRSATPALDSAAAFLAQGANAGSVQNLFSSIFSRGGSGRMPGINGAVMDSSGSPIPGTYA